MSAELIAAQQAIEKAIAKEAEEQQGARRVVADIAKVLGVYLNDKPIDGIFGPKNMQRVLDEVSNLWVEVGSLRASNRLLAGQYDSQPGSPDDVKDMR